MGKVVSAIVPAFNEEKRIMKTLLAIKKIDYISKIFVINDGSIDRTKEIALSVGDVVLIDNHRNKGKGYALKIGVEKAIQESDIIAFLDADLEESATEAAKLIEPLLDNIADVTIAKFPVAKTKGGFGLVKALAKYGVYLNTGVILSTVLSGQRAFKRDVLESIDLNFEGYAIELGMTIDILKKGFHIKEVEVAMYHNETGRDIQGCLHRGKQFWHLLKALVNR